MTPPCVLSTENKDMTLIKGPSDKKNYLDKTDWWINKPGNKDKFDDHVSNKKFKFVSDLQQDQSQQHDGPCWTGVHFDASFV